MAIDEAVFRVSQTEESLPTLRFYSWSSPAVSIGYFQDVAREIDVSACRRNHIDIVRRPTGGKAVLHDEDVTYAVIARDTDPLFTKDILGTYRVISKCIASGLAFIGINAEITNNSRILEKDPLETSCFSSPSRYELLVDNRKICGSAQLRSRGVFLQHGSILMDFDPHKTYDILLPHLEDCERQIFRLKQSVTSVTGQAASYIDIAGVCHVLKKGFEATLGVELLEGKLTPEEEKLKNILVEQKYSTVEWNMEGGCRKWTSET
jgi:lipoyl(octanoyl) transferase